MASTGASSGTSRPGSALDHVLSLAASCLNKDAPNLKTAPEVIALVGHACMTAVGFRLIGLGEEQKIEPASKLPKEWNATTTYSFKYAHEQSSMHYLLKIIQLGNNAVISALALGDDKASSFDVPARDYISLSALPLSPSPDLAAALQFIFISSNRLNDLISLFRINVIQRLAPGLQKEGYEDSFQSASESRDREAARPRTPPRDRDDPRHPAEVYPLRDPLAAPPRRPVPAGDFPPPGFEDEYEINAPPRWLHAGPPYSGERPLNIGERDLYPPGLSPHDPLRPHFGPPRGGGGMHPTFDDPMFGGNGGQAGSFDPQVPPGARYDPVGPSDGRPFGRGLRRPMPGRGNPPTGNGFGGFGGGFGGGII
ncbi:hypothetical protein LOZ36_000938 [Ophidiomyces ophidiicola]|nr:hypothetical protein LOZ36_000938 [Ophidiomyces ophidiicola]